MTRPTAQRPRGADVDAAISRLWRQLASTGLDETLRAIDQEQYDDAYQLVAELRARPETWSPAASDPRYGTPEVVWQLLAAAESETPPAGLPLVHLATNIALHLAALHPALSLYQQLVVEGRCARAHRLLDLSDAAGADLELQRAAELLNPDLDYGRALYCHALARLRRNQQRLEEALALAQRAVFLFDAFGSSVELGRAEVELGWTLLQTGDPAEALAIFGQALELVREVPVAAATGQLGLAVALLETTGPPSSLSPADIDRVLAEAHQAIAAVGDPLTRLRLRWLAAHLTFRRGRRWSAIRRFLRILNAFINVSEDHDAARVLLDLLTLCHDHNWLKLLTRPELQRAFAVLGSSPTLHRRARSVLTFLAYVLNLPSPYSGEVLLHVQHYLEASRHLSALPFHPTNSQPILFLDWNQQAPALRRTICREVGTDEAVADLSSGQIDVGLQETISWRYEFLQRVRVVFPGGTTGPLAPRL